MSGSVRHFGLAGIRVTISVAEAMAQRMRNNFAYRLLLGPALGFIRRLTRAESGDGEAAPDAAWSPEAQIQLSPQGQAILDRIEGIEWYHTIELPQGVRTPGFVDHGPQLELYRLPEDMSGMRALDVATYDGYWAFEMERRGAEVTAIDIGSWAEFDIPLPLRKVAGESGAAEKVTGQGFWAAHQILGSNVDRKVVSVYELSPDTAGTFDFVFVSDLLLHLRDPQLALENITSVLRRPGTALVAEVYNPRLEDFGGMAVTEFVGFGEYVWWLPSTAALKAMMKVAGFDRIEELDRFRLRARAEELIHKVILRGHIGRKKEANEDHGAEA